MNYTKSTELFILYPIAHNFTKQQGKQQTARKLFKQ